MFVLIAADTYKRRSYRGIVCNREGIDMSEANEESMVSFYYSSLARSR